MATKDRIYSGDTLPVAYETRKPNEDDPNDSRGLPVTPIAAIATVYNSTVGEFLEIGGVGILFDTCTIEPQEGIAPSDKGGVIRYVVKADVTSEPGDYTLFIKAEFTGDIILTENRRFKVEEYR